MRKPATRCMPELDTARLANYLGQLGADGR